MTSKNVGNGNMSQISVSHYKELKNKQIRGEKRWNLKD